MEKSRIIVETPRGLKLFWASAMEVTEGKLTLYLEEVTTVSAKTTRGIFTKEETVKTTIERQRYTAASFAAGQWTSAYAKRAIIEEEKGEDRDSRDNAVLSS